MFKELIQAFFQEFMEGFFPEEFTHINFSNVKFLEQEVFTDILKGEKRRIDILAEVTLKEENSIVLIHVEPQSTYQKEFHERMFIYCSRLYEKYRKPILPIAVFSYNNKKEVPTQFTIEFPTWNIIDFRYLQLHLIKKDWREYLKSDNPAAAALLSKMGYTEIERVKVKMEFLRMLSRMEIDPAKMELIYGFFETYLKLTDKEEIQMREEITNLPKEEANRVLELPNSYYEKGIEKGVEKVVYQMVKKGLSDELIADLSDLSVMEVKEIRKRADEES